MLLQTLQHLGLSDKEARVYLAAVETGSCPVSQIAVKAKLNRITTYDIIEKLMKKGLIHSMTRNKIKYFSATDPEQLVENFQKKAQELKNALPELKKLRQDHSRTAIQYYEGVEGIKKIYADTLKSRTEILNYCHSKGIRTLWPTYDQEYVKERMKKNIRLKGIAPDDEYGRRVQINDHESLRETRLIPKEKFNFTNEIHIYDHKVAIISFEKDNVIGMMIESPEISDSQRAIFNIVWEFAEEKQRETSAQSRGSSRQNENFMKVNKVKDLTPKPHNDQAQLF